MRIIAHGSSQTRSGLVALIVTALTLMPMHASAKRKRSAPSSLPATLVVYSLTEGLGSRSMART